MTGPAAAPALPPVRRLRGQRVGPLAVWGSKQQVALGEGQHLGGLARQGNRRQSKSPTAFAEGDVDCQDLADPHTGHQREDVSADLAQDWSCVAAQLGS